jgi:hypothetical protein
MYLSLKMFANYLVLNVWCFKFYYTYLIIILYLKVKCYFILCKKTVNVLEDLNILGVSEIRVLILTSERTIYETFLYNIL